MKEKKYSRDSSCYLPKSLDGKGANHNFSIPGSTFSETNAYFRVRDETIFIKTKSRSLQLGTGTNYCKYHVAEENFHISETGYA